MAEGAWHERRVSSLERARLETELGDVKFQLCETTLKYVEVKNQFIELFQRMTRADDYEAQTIRYEGIVAELQGARKMIEEQNAAVARSNALETMLNQKDAEARAHEKAMRLKTMELALAEARAVDAERRYRVCERDNLVLREMDTVALVRENSELKMELQKKEKELQMAKMSISQAVLARHSADLRMNAQK